MTMSPDDLRTMPEARLREWFSSLSKEDLVEALVTYILTYERDREAASFAPWLDLKNASWPQVVNRLKDNLKLPELGRFVVRGEQVSFVSDSGRELPLTASGALGPPAPAGGAIPAPDSGDAALPTSPSPRRTAPVRQDEEDPGDGEDHRSLLEF